MTRLLHRNAPVQLAFNLRNVTTGARIAEERGGGSCLIRAHWDALLQHGSMRHIQASPGKGGRQVTQSCINTGMKNALLLYCERSKQTGE